MKKSYIFILVILSLLVVVTACKIQNNKNDTKEGSYQEEENLDMSKIDEFYDNELTKGYKSVLKLDKDYKLKDALDDNLFVIADTTYNSNLYDNFIDKVKRGEDAFLRVVMTTIEGDILIRDIKVENRKVEVIFDDTRDRYLDDDDRKIELKELTLDDLDFESNSKDFINSLIQI